MNPKPFVDVHLWFFYRIVSGESDRRLLDVEVEHLCGDCRFPKKRLRETLWSRGLKITWRCSWSESLHIRRLAPSATHVNHYNLLIYDFREQFLLFYDSRQESERNISAVFFSIGDIFEVFLMAQTYSRS